MRPTAVLVLGILGILFGVLGLCCNLVTAGSSGFLSAVSESLPAEQRGSPDVQMLSDPTFARYLLVFSGIGTLLSFLLVVSSILLLQMKPVGYTLMMTTCSLLVVSLLVQMVSELTLLAPIYEKYGQSPRWWGYLLPFLYPVVALIVLTRPSIKEAFRQ